MADRAEVSDRAAEVTARSVELGAVDAAVVTAADKFENAFARFEEGDDEPAQADAIRFYAEARELAGAVRRRRAAR